MKGKKRSKIDLSDSLIFPLRWFAWKMIPNGPGNIVANSTLLTDETCNDRLTNSHPIIEEGEIPYDLAEKS